jgi:phosphatidylinositol glycan class S
LTVARTASKLAASVLYDPEMVPLLHFPDEHKYAVYVPYLLPACAVLVGGVLRHWRARQTVPATQ